MAPPKSKPVSPSSRSTTLPPNTRSTSLNAISLSASDQSLPGNALTNNDLMSALISLRKDFLESNKALSEAQSSQFDDLKHSFERLSVQIDGLKAENSKLRHDVEDLSNRVAALEHKEPCGQIASISAEVLHETFEREKCALNVLAYGVPESSSASSAQRITDDRNALECILLPLGCPIHQSLRLMRLGRLGQNDIRPLKIFCDSKEAAFKLHTAFVEHKRSGYSLPLGFRIARDKTQLQRKQLKSCHQELDNRSGKGEKDLCIRFVNGIPNVVSSQSKNVNTHHLHPPKNYHLRPRVVNQSQASTKTVVA